MTLHDSPHCLAGNYDLWLATQDNALSNGLARETDLETNCTIALSAHHCRHIPWQPDPVQFVRVASMEPASCRGSQIKPAFATSRIYRCKARDAYLAVV